MWPKQWNPLQLLRATIATINYEENYGGDTMNHALGCLSDAEYQAMTKAVQGLVADGETSSCWECWAMVAHVAGGVCAATARSVHWWYTSPLFIVSEQCVGNKVGAELECRYPLHKVHVFEVSLVTYDKRPWMLAALNEPKSGAWDTSAIQNAARACWAAASQAGGVLDDQSAAFIVQAALLRPDDLVCSAV